MGSRVLLHYLFCLLVLFSLAMFYLFIFKNEALKTWLEPLCGCWGLSKDKIHCIWWGQHFAKWGLPVSVSIDLLFELVFPLIKHYPDSFFSDLSMANRIEAKQMRRFGATQLHRFLFNVPIVATTLLPSAVPGVFKARVILCQPLHKVHQWSFSQVSERPLLLCGGETNDSRGVTIYFQPISLISDPPHTIYLLASNFLSFSRVPPWESACFLARNLIFSFLWYAKSITHPSASYHIGLCYHLSIAFITSSFPLVLAGWTLIRVGLWRNQR